MRFYLVLSMLLLCLLVLGCEEDSGPDAADDDDSSGDADTDSDSDGDGDADSDADADSDSDGDADCPDDDPGRYIYLIDRDDGNIYKFDPEFSALDLVGPLSCPGTGSTTPGSMSVTREGTAYVQYSDAKLYALNVFDATGCEYTGFDSNTTGFGKFGMGFARDTSATEDTLYVANASNLAVLDVDSWTGSIAGPVPSQSELTGNGAGEVWGFFPLESPPAILQLDRDTGAVLDTLNLPGNFIDNVDTFAFAFWGGSFYMFIREYGMGSSTDIYKVDEDGLEEFMMDTGRTIVGAGVSTCAPITPPE